MPKKLLLLFILLGILAAAIYNRQSSNRVRTSPNMWQIWTLNTLDIWKERGIKACHALPIQTWGNAGDKFIDIYPRLVSETGDNYYVSYPPLSFYTGYAFLELFHLPFEADSLALLNLILQLVTALFLFLLLQSLLKKKWNDLNIPVLAGLSVYLFTPASVRLHAEVFFPEMLSQVLLVIASYLFYKIILSGKANTIRKTVLALLFFGLNYTEWIGVFAAFSFSLVCFLERKKITEWRQLILLILVPSVASIFLATVQYSSIAGFDAYAHALWARFSARSGYLSAAYSEERINIFSSDAYVALIHNIWNAFSWFLLLIPFGIWLMIRKWRSWPWSRLLLFSLPVFLHFILFANFSFIHAHGLAKLVFPFSIAVALYLNVAKKAGVIVCLILISASVVMSLIIQPVKVNDDAKHLALFIDQHVRDDESIFVNGSLPPSTIFPATFFAKRNMKPVNDILSMESYIDRFHLNKGILLGDSSGHTIILASYSREDKR